MAAASVFKGEYLLRYVHFRDSLPADQRLACEEIFAEQSAVLDSVMVGCGNFTTSHCLCDFGLKLEQAILIFASQ